MMGILFIGAIARGRSRSQILFGSVLAPALLVCWASERSWGAGEDCAQTVYLERKTKLIPGGAGQKPFDVTRHTIPISEIQGGGPARDAIPALVRPKIVRADQMGRLLKDSDRVVGVSLNGEAKAYPVGILNWHELVNDELGGRPLLVTW